MGNCLVLHEKKGSRFRKTDEINQINPTSLKVHQILLKCLGYEISKERLRMVKQFNTVGVMRIKLVLSKQELIEMIKNGGVSIDGAIIAGLFRELSRNMGAEEQRSLVRSSALKSIAEEE